MIIACPSCSAKYQLADSKVKASGTKVRCPRCSHTFTVYKEQKEEAEDIGSERTELFVRRNEHTNLQKPPPSEENIFDQKTSVSPPPVFSPEETAPPQKKHAAPEVPPEKPSAPKVEKSSASKQDPARIVTPDPVEDEASEEDTRPHEDSPQENSEPSREIKPFGDATLFEIQRGFKKKGSKRIFKIAGVTAAVALIVLTLQFFLPTGGPTSNQAQLEIDLPYDLSRPAGWYKDDPQVYQDTLGQIAALPPQEQDKLENRALLAEALILNGLLTGATDQVISGMGFSSSLVVSHSLSPLGYYGIAAYALWNEERRTLQDLVERWPEAYRDDPEFALVEFGAATANREWKRAFEHLRSLLQSEPDFQRANDFGLLIALRQPQAAQEFLGQNLVEKMKTAYLRHRTRLERDLNQLPKLHKEIDQYMATDDSASSQKPARSSSNKRSAKAEETKADDKAGAPIPPEKTFPEEKGVQKSTAPSAPAAKKQSSKLPSPSANLIAQNKVSQRQRQDAMKLFESGNTLYKAGKADEALKSYRDALKLDPEFADIYKRIGMIYMNRQESDRALRSFRIYLQLKPDSEDKALVEGWISSLQ